MDNFKFEKEIEKVLMANHFLTTGTGKAVREMCCKKHIYISIVTYKEMDNFDKQHVEKNGIRDACKNVYWIQFRNNTGGHFYFIDDAAYIYSPSGLQAFIDNWKDHYLVSVENMRERMQREEDMQQG